jgi:serine/threonine-protein kinase
VSGGALEPDAVIGDRYRLHRRLGEGAMGWVWEASHVYTHARFALKFLKGARDEDRRRFYREVRAAAAVRHPNVIGVHDFVELPNGTLVMVMDLLEGETLGAVLRREKRVALPVLAAILLPVVGALEAAHAAGIVHRDLKPENVFLSEKSGKEPKEIGVKVLDFGIAKLTALDGLAARSQALTGTGSMLGTPYYMSPEQIVAEKDLDARADIWSLGVVMYECLAGIRPTEADNVGRVLKRILLVDFEPITEHCKDLPDDVVALIGTMLVGDRNARLRDLAEVRAVLARHAAEAIPASARGPGPEVVDAHADTVITPSERPELIAREETHRGVSMSSDKPTGARARIAFGVAVVLAGAALVGGWSLASRTRAPADPALSMAIPTHDPPTPTASNLVIASAPAPPPATAAPPPSEAASPASAPVPSVAVVAPRARPPSPSPSPSPAPSPRAAIVVAAAAAPRASAATSPSSVPVPSALPAPTPPQPPPGFAASRKD